MEMHKDRYEYASTVAMPRGDSNELELNSCQLSPKAFEASTMLGAQHAGREN